MGQVQTTVARTPDATTVVRLIGRIDHAATDQLRRALARALVHEPTRGLVVDLDGVTALDPLALGMLQAFEATARDMDRTIVFHISRSPISDRLGRDGIPDSRVAG